MTIIFVSNWNFQWTFILWMNSMLFCTCMIWKKQKVSFSFLLFYKMCLFSLRLLAEVVLEKTTKISRISSFSAKQFCPQRQIDRESAPGEHQILSERCRVTVTMMKLQAVCPPSSISVSPVSVVLNRVKKTQSFKPILESEFKKS